MSSNILMDPEPEPKKQRHSIARSLDSLGLQQSQKLIHDILGRLNSASGQNFKIGPTFGPTWAVSFDTSF